MKAALISLGSKSSLLTIEAMKKYFDSVDNINLKKIEANLLPNKLEVLYEGNPFGSYDCVYIKGSYRYATLLRAIARSFPETTYTPLKPDTFTIGHDKILTHIVLMQYKVPQPKTYLSSSPQAAKHILESINYPIIMKFPQGTQGKGVMYSESLASASSMLDALATLRQPFLIQEYVDTEGIDIRALVIGERVAAAMKRKAVVGETRANIHAGGKGIAFEPDFRIKKVAVDAAKAVGADICAVDILESPKGPLVIEVNLSPGIRGLMEATKADVADKIAKFLFDKAKENNDAEKIQKANKIMKEIGIGQEIITNIDFRADRMLLPDFITKISEITEKDETVISVKKGSVSIRKL